MLSLTENKLKKKIFTKYDLKEADYSKLPFPDDKFDVVYSAYMLDIIPKNEMGTILREFKRVLKPTGRVVLLNTSKKFESSSFLEKLYLYLPSQLALYFLGGCRPVLMKEDVIKVEFKNVKRYYLGGKYPSELIIANK
jgi:ubiquinone/menaquinone biosynthesis C-methylase UbiE